MLGMALFNFLMNVALIFNWILTYFNHLHKAKPFFV